MTYLAGFMLIALGLKFLGVIRISSIEILGFMMMIFGISYVFLSFGKNRKGLLFTSSVIFLVGVTVFLVNNFNFFNTSALLYPAAMFIFGISFLMVFIDGDTSLVYLIVSVAFFIMGVVITAIKGKLSLRVFFASLLEVAVSYWPVIFIVVVVYLLVLRIEHKNSEDK